MTRRERYVFDTNVIVSALLFEQSKPGQAFYAALERGELVLSLPVVKELNDVLSRPKFDRYVFREERERFLGLLLHESKLVDITEQLHACRDPNDDKFLELAISAEATCLVSGDDDLLQLNPFRGIPIVTPEEFLASSSV